MRFAVPFALFLVLVLLLGLGLKRDPHVLPSALIDQPAPVIDRPLLQAPQQQLHVETLRGRVWLLNVWASWCGPCREELPLLVTLAARDGVAIYGLNYKDSEAAAVALLQRHGNPYVASAVDADGRVGMNYGVYGVPETFVIDGQGRVRYRYPGAVTADVWREQLLPVVRSLR